MSAAVAPFSRPSTLYRLSPAADIFLCGALLLASAMVHLWSVVKIKHQGSRSNCVVEKHAMERLSQLVSMLLQFWKALGTQQICLVFGLGGTSNIYEMKTTAIMRNILELRLCNHSVSWDCIWTVAIGRTHTHTVIQTYKYCCAVCWLKKITFCWSHRLLVWLHVLVRLHKQTSALKQAHTKHTKGQREKGRERVKRQRES